MLDVFDRLYIAMQTRFNRFIHDEEGAVDIVAIVVLIGIVVLVAIVFKDEITKLIKDLFGKITNTASDAVTDKKTTP